MIAPSGNSLGIVCACYRDDPQRRGPKAVRETYLSLLSAVPRLLPFRRRPRVDGARQRAWPTGRFLLAMLATPEGISPHVSFDYPRHVPQQWLFAHSL